MTTTITAARSLACALLALLITPPVAAQDVKIWELRIGNRNEGK